MCGESHWSAVGELVEDVVGVGETARLVLRVDPVPVHDDVKDPARALLQGGNDAELLLDRGRETRGPAQVASSRAVGDLDRHGLEDNPTYHITV